MMAKAVPNPPNSYAAHIAAATAALDAATADGHHRLDAEDMEAAEAIKAMACAIKSATSGDWDWSEFICDEAIEATAAAETDGPEILVEKVSTFLRAARHAKNREN